MQAGRAVVDHVRKNGPAIMQVHTYRFNGHSPADPEHERGRKQEKSWARNEQDPIKIFEQYAATNKLFSEDELGTSMIVILFVTPLSLALIYITMIIPLI